MQIKTFITLCAVAVATTTFAPSLRAATADEVQDAFWKDPEFVRGFMGSFQINRTVEPAINAEEQRFMQHLVTVIETNRVAAVQLVQRVLERTEPEEDNRSARARREAEEDPTRLVISNKASFLFLIGNLQVLEGEVEQAKEFYQRALDEFPTFLRAAKNLAVLQVQDGDFETARRNLTRALELGGNEGDLYGLLGACNLSLGNYPSATAAYERAMLLAPDKVDWKLGAARALLSQERYDQASALFAELIKMRPDDHRFWLFQANCFIGLNRPVEAAHNYEIVREMGRADGATLTSLGDIYLSRELKELAFQAYSDAFAADPERLDRVIRAAESLAVRGAVEESDRLLGVIRESDAAEADDEQALRMLRLESRIALSRKDDAKAADIMEEILRKNPLDGATIINLAAYYGRQDEFDRACLLFDRATRIEDVAAEAHLKYAQMLVSEKRYERAIEHLQQSLALEPRDNVERYLEGVKRVFAASRS